MPRHSAAEVLPLLEAAGKGIKVTELAEELLSAFGGYKEFARLYVDEFKKSHGMAKQRLLEGVMRAVGQASAMTKDLGDDLDKLSDAEIEAELAEIMGQADADETPPLAIPVVAEPPPDPGPPPGPDPGPRRRRRRE